MTEIIVQTEELLRNDSEEIIYYMLIRNWPFRIYCNTFDGFSIAWIPLIRIYEICGLKIGFIFRPTLFENVILMNNLVFLFKSLSFMAVFFLFYKIIFL